MRNEKTVQQIRSTEREIKMRRQAAPNLANDIVRRQNATAIEHAEDRLTDLLVKAAQAGVIVDTGDESPASRVARWMAAERAA